MRVRISYAADLEEIPQELDQLFLFVRQRALWELPKELKRVSKCLEEQDIESIPELIEQIRINLSDIDQRLMDIESIAQRYINVLNNEGAGDVEQGRSGVDTPEERLVDRDTKQPTGNPHFAGT